MALVWDVLGPFGPYWLVRALLLRGVALVYLVGFLVAAFQFRPLAGEDGLLPIADYRDRNDFRDRPSLFYLVPTDRALAAGAWVGVGLSVLALLGVPTGAFAPVDLDLGVWPAVAAHVALWGTLWALYLSFLNAGQTFYGFGWESMLTETGFLAVFLGPAAVAAPAVVVLLVRWVLFRNMFGAGLIKLRGDDCWRELTCLDYHYETQPMPNPLSRLAHFLPDRAHRAGVVTNHVVELAVPFLYFAPQPVAAAAGLVTIGFQGWLLLTGNFAFLNLLTIVLAVATLSDPLLSTALPVSAHGAATVAPLPLPAQVAVAGLVVLVVALSYYPVRNMIGEGQRMNAAFDPLHLVNTYGAFGSITRTRYEVVLQGTRDEQVTPDTEWESYEIPGKPTDPGKRPPQVAPYHYRLGWQLWFAAMARSPRRHPWFYHLVAKLLAGDDGVRSLLARDPFPDDPPEHVRALRYRYEFTDPREDTDRYWTRERVGTYFGPVSLSDYRFRQLLERLGWDVPGDDGDPGSVDDIASRVETRSEE